MALCLRIGAAQMSLVGGEEAWGLRIGEYGRRCRDPFAGEDDVNGDAGAT